MNQLVVVLITAVLAAPAIAQQGNTSSLSGDAFWVDYWTKPRVILFGPEEEAFYQNNLVLSQRRADWVKQALISRGIPENRIRFAVGWGQLYPLCPEKNDERWTKNRLVRFEYAPNS